MNEPFMDTDKTGNQIQFFIFLKVCHILVYNQLLLHGEVFPKNQFETTALRIFLKTLAFIEKWKIYFFPDSERNTANYCTALNLMLTYKVYEF